MSAGYRLAEGGMRADWSRGGAGAIGDPAPCVLGCGEYAILRHPLTGRPCHKVCDDARAAAEQVSAERRLTDQATTDRTISGV